MQKPLRELLMAFSFRLALLLSAIAFTPIAFAQNDRDFSGRWILRPELCEIQSLPEPPDASLKIDQQSFTIHVFRILGGKPSRRDSHLLHRRKRE